MQYFTARWNTQCYCYLVHSHVRYLLSMDYSLVRYLVYVVIIALHSDVNV